MIQVTDETLSEILKNYDTTKTSLDHDVQTLKTWMKSQPHLPKTLGLYLKPTPHQISGPLSDDKSLQNFLIFNKCSVEKAKSRIDMYYTVRSRRPEFFSNPEKLAKVVSGCFQVAILPKLTPEKYRVMFTRVADPERFERMFDPYWLVQYNVNMEEIRLKEDIMFGDVFIFDAKGVSVGIMKKISISLLAEAIRIYKKVFSMPLKNCYILNAPPYISSLMTLVKLVTKPKVFERIHLCPDTKILFEKFDKEMIPMDYGGFEKSVGELDEILTMKYKEYKERFDYLDDVKIDESLRPEPLKDDEYLGFHGNFKKLQID